MAFAVADVLSSEVPHGPKQQGDGQDDGEEVTKERHVT